MKKIISTSAILLFLILFVGAGCQNKNDQVIAEQQIKIDELTKKVDELSKKSLEAEVIKTPVVPTQEVSQPKAIPPKEDLDRVLINYKLDVQDGEDLRNALVNAAFNTPEQLCPSIIGTRTTQDHIYFLVSKNLNLLDGRYGKYKSKIQYIGNNLPGLWDTLAITKDKCEAVGYFIP